MKRFDQIEGLRKKRNGEAGVTILEYIIALVIIMVAFIAWLELTATAVKNGSFVKRIGDVKGLASSKAADLAKRADELVKKIPKNQRRAGTVFPNRPIDGYFELLDASGAAIPNARKALSYFERQWLVVKDLPAKGEVTVHVSVVYKEAGRTSIIRYADAVKTDGLTESKSGGFKEDL